MHRGALAALVERGLNSACLRKIGEASAPLGMPQKVVQRLKSEGIILRAHEYHKDHYVWRAQVRSMTIFWRNLRPWRIVCHPK